MDARRQDVARIAAPLAVLLVATGAILLVRGALRDHHDATPTTTHPKVRKHRPAPRAVVPVAGTTASTPTTAAPTTTLAATTVVNGKPYTVVAGDTFEKIAAKEHTTVDDLLRANPGVTPTTLQIGQKIVVPQ